MKRMVPDSLWGILLVAFSLGVAVGCALHAAVPAIPLPRILPEGASILEPSEVEKER